MELSLDHYHCKYIIRSYKPGELLINEERLTHSVLLFPEEWISPWAPQTLSELKPEHFVSVLKFQPEIFILGTGPRLIFPSTALFAPLYAQKIGVECMDTGAACRTYHVLMSEHRKVAAGLLI